MRILLCSLFGREQPGAVDKNEMETKRKQNENRKKIESKRKKKKQPTPLTSMACSSSRFEEKKMQEKKKKRRNKKIRFAAKHHQHNAVIFENHLKKKHRKCSSVSVFGAHSIWRAHRLHKYTHTKNAARKINWRMKMQKVKSTLLILLFANLFFLLTILQWTMYKQ